MAGMKPHEFWNCTFKDAKKFVEAFYKNKQIDYKNQIMLLDAMASKIINANPFIVAKAQHISLMEIFNKQFEDESEEEQNYDENLKEQIKNLRARM